MAVRTRLIGKRMAVAICAASVMLSLRVTAQIIPPVRELLRQAEQLSAQGSLERASAMLERALRIAPQNPLIWHQLAQVRWQQGDAEQAIALSAKADSTANAQILSGTRERAPRQDWIEPTVGNSAIASYGTRSDQTARREQAKRRLALALDSVPERSPEIVIVQNRRLSSGGLAARLRAASRQSLRLRRQGTGPLSRESSVERR